MSFLDTDSDFELAVRRRVTERAIRVQERQREDLAVRIVNTLAKSLKKGSGSSR
jgi:hypothetical protein